MTRHVVTAGDAEDARVAARYAKIRLAARDYTGHTVGETLN
jgi:hypothetical protein